MASANKAQKEKHKCPPLPPGEPKVTPFAYTGQSVEECRKMFRAWCGVVAAQTPRPSRHH